MHIFKCKDFSVEGVVLHFYLCGFFSFWQYEEITLPLFILKYFPKNNHSKQCFNTHTQKKAVSLHEPTHFLSLCSSLSVNL